MGVEQQVGGVDRATATDGVSTNAASVADGLAAFAGAFAALPAVRATSLAEVERCRVSAVLADGWNLAAFTPTGALVLEVVDAAGGRIEVAGGMSDGWGRVRHGEGSAGVAGIEGAAGRGDEGIEGLGGRRDERLSRATSHGAVRAAWGAPPGRRVAVMGMMPGPGGGMVRASCGLALLLPAAAIDTPLRVAAMLSFHAAMYAAERRTLPSDGALAVALDQLELELGIPRGPRGRVAWADQVVDRIVEELGGLHGPAADMLATSGIAAR